MEGENNNNDPLQKKITEEKLGNKDIDDQDSSEWSLASLEELKALNLRDLEENEEPMEHHHKEKAPIQVKFPQKPTVLPNAPLHQVGKIIFIVGELLIVESIGGAFVVDLQNWICDENRNIFGFIIDVFGKIDKPFYSIKPEVVIDFTPFIGQPVYYIQGSSKILRDEDIKSMKSKSALQAEEQDDISSDEENVRIQRDFSDEKHERKKSPPRRINKFRDNQRHEHREEGYRDRTREQNYRQNRNHSNRGRNQQNQRYLNNMYSMHYNQMMRLYNGQFDPNNVPPMQNPYISQNRPQSNTPHNNIAQFGGNSYPGQFYGQSFPSTQNGQPQMGLFPQVQQQQGLFHNVPPQQGMFPNTNPNPNPNINPYNNGRQ